MAGLVFFSKNMLNLPLISVTFSALGLILWLILSVIGLFSLSSIFHFWILFPFVICVSSLIFPTELIWGLMALLLVVGPLLFLKKIYTQKIVFSLETLNQLTRLQKILLVFLSLYLLAKLLKAFTPGAQNDVLTYALLAPKDWALFNDSVTFRPDFPNLFMSTYFEYFYYAYFVLFKSFFLNLITKPSTHFEFYLAVMQIFAQLLVAVASYIFIPILIYLVNRKNFYASFLTIILVESLQLQTWTWYLAKNDSIPFFILLFAYYLIFIKKNYKLAALYLGIALGVKFSNIYPVSLIALFLLLKHRRALDFLMLIKMVPFFLLGFLPIFLRNYFFTGNPFYPVMILGFKNLFFAKRHMDYINLYSAPSSFLVAFDKTLFYFMSLKQLLILGVLSLLARRYIYPLLMVLFIFILSKVSGPPLEWRLYSTLLLFYVIWIGEIFTQPKIAQLAPGYLIILLLPFLLFSKFNLESFWKVPKLLSESTKTVLSREQDNFSLILENNLNHYNTLNYQFVSPIHDIYYSRFKAISNEMGVSP